MGWHEKIDYRAFMKDDFIKSMLQNQKREMIR